MIIRHARLTTSFRIFFVSVYENRIWATNKRNIAWRRPFQMSLCAKRHNCPMWVTDHSAHTQNMTYFRGTQDQCQVPPGTKCCIVAPNICGSSVWNWLPVTFERVEFWGCSFIFFYHSTSTSSGPTSPHCRGLWSHSNTPHSVGFLWTSDQNDAETSTWQHITPTTDIHAPGGIRTHNPSKWGAAGPHLRSRGHWDRRWRSYSFVKICAPLTFLRQTCGIHSPARLKRLLLFIKRNEE